MSLPIVFTNVFYDDLLRFQGSIAVYDKDEKDTLWVRLYYNEFEKVEVIKEQKDYLQHSCNRLSKFMIEDLTFHFGKNWKDKIKINTF